MRIRMLLMAGALILVQIASPAAHAASTETASAGHGDTVLLNASEILTLRQHEDAFTAILRECTAHLKNTASPVPVFAPAPHDIATGLNGSNNNGKQLAVDAHVAYQAGLCFLRSGDTHFAKHAQHIVDAWAGTLKQVPTPRGKDNINFKMPYMIMAASWVRGAGDWNSATFNNFLLHTVLPVPETRNPNNHGAWGVLLEASAAAYLDNAERSNAARSRWQTLIEGAVAADGSLSREISRSGTSNWHGGPGKGIKGLAYTHDFLLPASEPTTPTRYCRPQGPASSVHG